METIKPDRHASTVSIAKELTIAPQTVWNHLRVTAYAKKFNVWMNEKNTH